MNRTAFEASLDQSDPPPLSAPLRALWHARKGAWDTAHGIVQDDSGPECAWIHAYLHRVEGDLGNARYWYNRAGKPEPATSDLEAEWSELVDRMIG